MVVALHDGRVEVAAAAIHVHVRLVHHRGVEAAAQRAQRGVPGGGGPPWKHTRPGAEHRQALVVQQLARPRALWMGVARSASGEDQARSAMWKKCVSASASLWASNPPKKMICGGNQQGD